MASLCRRLSTGGAAAPAALVHYRLPAGICVVQYGCSIRRPMRLVVEGSAVGGGAWVRSDVGGRGEKVGPCSYAVEDRGEAADGGRDAVVGSRNRAVEVVAAAVATVMLGVANRVLYKLALVSLKLYPFFLAQLATFGYVIEYFVILYIRHHAGVVTDEMLDAPKAPFIVVGLLEALAAATGMAAGAILSGASIPILSQVKPISSQLLSGIHIFLIPVTFASA